MAAFQGWGDMANFAAEGTRQATAYRPPTLSPFAEAGATGVGGVANITSQGVLADQRAYMDPYVNDVVNTSLAGYDQNAGMQRAAYAANGARNGAFGGSRFGIGEGMLGGQLALGRGQLESGLRSGAWNTALGAAQGQASQNQNTQLQRTLAQANIDSQRNLYNAQGRNSFSLAGADMQAQERARQLNALSLLSQQAGAYGEGQRQDVTAYGANDRADLSLLAQLGEQQRAIEAQQAMAPATQLSLEGNALGAAPLGMFAGQTIDSTGNSTTTQSGGLLASILGSLAQGAGSALAMSDRRLKRNIVKLGEEVDGLGVYAFDYVWPGPRQRGVMADEVASLRPWALGPSIGGFASVDYGRL